MRVKPTHAARATLVALCFTAGSAIAENGEDEHHDLDEIIVKAKPIERTVKELAQPVAVITGDALTKREAPSLGESLASEPGVSASYFGPVSSRPIIRGQFGERIRVLANGLDTLDASALSEDHAVSLDGILADRVEIVKGPATLLYGSGAAGGIVNVVDSRIHEQPLDTPFAGALSLGTDSATGKESAAFKLDASVNDFIFHLDAFRRETDDIDIPDFAESARLRALEEAEDEGEHEDEEEAFGTVENTDSEVSGGAAGLSFVGENAFVGFSVSRYDSEYGVPGPHAHGHEHEEHEHEHEEEHGEEEEIVRIDLDQTRYDLKAGVGFDSFFNNLRLDLVRNEYEHVELEGDAAGTIFDTEGTDARLEITHRPTAGFEGAIGLQYKRIDFVADGPEAFVPPSDTTQWSLFAFEEYRINDAWVLQGSARIEQQQIETPGQADYDESAFGASIGAIWAFADTMSLAANLALTERHPNATELYADDAHLAVQRIELGSVTLGNGVLDKEYSTNLDLTLRGNTDLVEWQVTGFINNVDDYILLSPTGVIDPVDELPIFEYQQADVELYGFEAEALVDLLDDAANHLHARLFADYVFGEEADTGEYLPRLPPLRYGLGLHYERDRFAAAVDAIYHSEQEKTASGELPTDSYTLVNAELSYTWQNPDVLLFVRGTNLGDEDARRHTSPLKEFVPLPGRSMQVGLRVDF